MKIPLNVTVVFLDFFASFFTFFSLIFLEVYILNVFVFFSCFSLLFSFFFSFVIRKKKKKNHSVYIRVFPILVMWLSFGSFRYLVIFERKKEREKNVLFNKTCEGQYLIISCLYTTLHNSV